MRDYDYHPDEDDVRVFDVPESGVLVRSDETYVGQTREPDPSDPAAPPVVLRHYAFATEWFKINATFDLAGDIIETGPPDGPYAVNCDIATPMLRVGRDVAAVDLFLDVLVRIDGSYRVADRDEFEQALTARLISPSEAQHAEIGLARLIEWVTSGRLLDLLAEIPASTAARARAPLPFRRAPLSDVPSLAAHRRPSW